MTQPLQAATAGRIQAVDALRGFLTSSMRTPKII